MWQVLFDGGRQQRYLPDRQAVLRYVLAVGPHAASPRFEVHAEAERIRLADGSDGGRRFALVEVIDLARPGEIERLRRTNQALRDEIRALDSDPVYVESLLRRWKMIGPSERNVE